MKKKLGKGGKILGIVFLVLLGVMIVLSLIGNVAHAAGLIDETVDSANMYSKYPLGNYQLDFYVDNSWAWLPWNWKDGIGKNIMYGVYAITNVIWWLSLQISNVTGYVVQEAFKLDFISDAASSIGKNIQILAGVSQNGFSSEGFYPGFLLIFILILGIYVAYTGIIKRESSKAIQAVINFLVVFIVSASFIAYAPSYIEKVNDFSKDISTAALSLGTKITMPDSDVEGQDSVDLIRDTLFSIQVRQPWLLIQFGTTDVEEIGEDRVAELLEISPDDNDGEDREEFIKSEVEDEDNANMSVTKVMPRLGTVAFLFLFNIGISIFVFLLTGNMIFSQILFLIYAMFLPISLLLSMLPSYNHMARRAIEKLFNTIMLRAGITLLITVAFSLSSMCYSLTESYPLFLVMFLQIIVFFGIYSKMGDILGMFSLQGTDGQRMTGAVRRQMNKGKRMTRSVGRMINSAIVGSAAGSAAAKNITGKNDKEDEKAKSPKTAQSNVGSRLGAKAGALAGVPGNVKDKVTDTVKSVKDAPTNAQYAVKKNVDDVKSSFEGERAKRQAERQRKSTVYDQEMAKRKDYVNGKVTPEHETKENQGRSQSEPHSDIKRQSTANKDKEQHQNRTIAKDDLTNRNKSHRSMVRADVNSPSMEKPAMSSSGRYEKTSTEEKSVTPSFNRREEKSVNPSFDKREKTSTTEHSSDTNSMGSGHVGRQSTSNTGGQKEEKLQSSFTRQELKREKQTSFTQQELKREKQSQLKKQKQSGSKGREK